MSHLTNFGPNHKINQIPYDEINDKSGQQQDSAKASGSLLFCHGDVAEEK